MFVEMVLLIRHSNYASHQSDSAETTEKHYLAIREMFVKSDMIVTHNISASTRTLLQQAFAGNCDQRIASKILPRVNNMTFSCSIHR